jgi:type IV secretion system protein VirB10
MSSSNVPPPPPPPPPTGTSGFNIDPSAGQQPEPLDLDNEDLKDIAPKVSGAPAKIFLVLGGFVLFALVVAYIMFSGKDKKKEEVMDDKPKQIAKDTDAPVLPPPPAPAPLPPRKPMLPPPNMPNIAPPPMIPAPPVSPEKKAANDKERMKRLQSSMVIGGSKSLSSSGEEKDPNDAFAATDPNMAFASKAMKASKADKAYATRIKNPSATIAQGKMIHAVLESAINTQLPGPIRAIVSRDIYAESGRARLIPKGSRLIGTYNTSMFRGQNRVFIVWTRVIRPDGIDIMVNSPGVDQLGRAGIEGNLDSRYFEILSSAVLTSLISIGIADFAEKGLGMDTSSTQSTNTDGSTSSSGSASAQASADAIQNITDTSKKVIADMVDTRSVVTIDQGTPINVFVNRDLIFPSSVTGGDLFVE